MDCRQARERLEEHLLDSLSPDEHRAVQRHLVECRPCAERAGELGEAVEVVRERSAPAAPPIPSRLREQVRHEAAVARRARTRAQTLRYVAALAAVILVTAAGAKYWLGETSSAPVPPADGRRARAPRELPVRPVARDRDGENSRVLWHVNDTYAAHESLADTPVLTAERLFVLQRDAFEQTRIMALHARTGDVLWTSAAMRVRKIAADCSRVYGLETDSPSHSSVVGLDGETGKVLWRFVLQTAVSPLSCSLVTADGGVLALAGREVCLLGGERGEMVWSRTLDQKRCPAVATAVGGRVLIAMPGELQCLDGADGSIAWTQALTGKASHFARPCAVACGERCYVARGLRNGAWDLFCFQLREPRLLWKRAAPDAATHIAADGEVVLVRGRRARQALAAETGEQLWEHQAEGCGPMSLADGIVYYVDMAGEGALVACEARTGEPLWREKSVRSCSEVLVHEGLVYLNSHAGRLYAFRALSNR